MYELIHNGKKIMLKLMNVTEVRSIRNQQVKKPSLTIMATEKEVEQVLDQRETIHMLVVKDDVKVEQG